VRRQAEDAEPEEVIAVFRPTRPGDADAVLRCVRTLRAVQEVIERRDCGTGAGGFKPGNKCAGGGDGGGSNGGGGSSGASAGDESVDSAEGGSAGPAHSEGSKANKQREANRQSRKTEDYTPTRGDATDTSDRHTVTPRYAADGRYIAPTSPDDWTPQRQEMHRQIIADATAGVPASEEPTFYMMGGGPAAGKSSIIRSGDVKHPEKHVLANPDEFKLDIPEYRDGLAAMDFKAAANAHEESSYLNKRVMAAARGNSQDVVWDGTGNHSIEKLESQVKPFRDAGYKVQADYVTCDTDQAVSRAVARAKKEGREVPEPEIRRTHASVSQIWPEAVRRGLFDQSDLYDTNAGGKPVRIASARGTKLTIHDEAAYQRFLDKAGGQKKRSGRGSRKR
jgi:predicted ABC-type ATPase